MFKYLTKLAEKKGWSEAQIDVMRLKLIGEWHSLSPVIKNLYVSRLVLRKEKEPTLDIILSLKKELEEKNEC